MIAERLQGPAFRNRALGSLYLDQGFLAGNGNYLRSEILWIAGLNPALKPAALSNAQIEKLAKETLRTVRRACSPRDALLGGSSVASIVPRSGRG